LRETEDQLRQAQKMEAVGQLTGGIAHDFNNMLTGVIGGLEMLRRRLADGRTDDVGRYLDAAVSSAERAATLTHRLLAFSRRQPLDPAPLDVAALVNSMADLLRRTLGERIRFEVIDRGPTGPARTDANQVESAILNLAINARDAMPNGGRLSIETSSLTVTAPTDDLLPGDYTVISVADTGEGMPPDVVAKAFDPFFTTKPIGQGTGLGRLCGGRGARQRGRDSHPGHEAADQPPDHRRRPAGPEWPATRRDRPPAPPNPADPLPDRLRRRRRRGALGTWTSPTSPSPSTPWPAPSAR
jgi:signal transduction histidine kinase